MMPEPICVMRKCRHYQGVKWFGDSEETENHICAAFPEGIPEDITYGPDRHMRADFRQPEGNFIKYEPEPGKEPIYVPPEIYNEPEEDEESDDF